MKYRVVTTSMSGLLVECNNIEAVDTDDAHEQAKALVKLTNKKLKKIIRVESKQETVVWPEGKS